MPQKELEYYRNKLDALSGELILKEYKVASLTNANTQLQNGFRLIVSISEQFNPEIDPDHFMQLIAEQTMVHLHFDRVLIFRNNGNTHYTAICASDGATPLSLSIPETLVREALNEHTSILVYGESVLTAAQKRVSEFIEFPFFVMQVFKGVEGETCLIVGGRMNEKKPLRYLPLSNTDQYILETLGNLYHGLMQRRNVEIKLEKERNRIAGDMHDNLGADITSISIHTNQMLLDKTLGSEIKTRIIHIKNAVKEAMEHMANTIWVLDSGNDQIGEMVSYFRQYAGKICDESDLDLQFQDSNIPSLQPISKDKRHHLLMIYREALNNISRHANADRVEIEISLIQNELNLVISDNGKGIHNIRPNANGLKNMEKRAFECGGSLVVDSTNGSGTRLTLKMPME